MHVSLLSTELVTSVLDAFVSIISIIANMDTGDGDQIPWWILSAFVSSVLATLLFIAAGHQRNRYMLKSECISTQSVIHDTVFIPNPLPESRQTAPSNVFRVE